MVIIKMCPVCVLPFEIMAPTGRHSKIPEPPPESEAPQKGAFKFQLRYLYVVAYTDFFHPQLFKHGVPIYPEYFQYLRGWLKIMNQYCGIFNNVNVGPTAVIIIIIIIIIITSEPRAGA